MTTYDKIFNDFRSYHSNALNVLLHLFTTPIMLLGVFWLMVIHIQEFAPAVACTIYLLLTFFLVPRKIWLLTGLTLIPLVAISMQIIQTTKMAGFIFVAGYLGQDFAHYVTGEQTFQSTYMKSTNWFQLLLEHTFYLVPLVWSSALHCDLPLIALPVQLSTVLYSKSESTAQLKDIATVRTWTREQGEATDHTIHHWFEDLPAPIYEAYERLAKSEDIYKAFRARFPEAAYDIDILPGMNEIYQTAPDHYSSDRVFYQQHVDGPWCIFPGCYVFRCLLCLTKNTNIKTLFPLDYSEKTLSIGDAVAFDFNREIHYIEANNPEVFESRIALKLHYAVYPKFFLLAWCGKLCGYLTTKYDQLARWWFLQTLNPENIAANGGTSATLWVTYFTQIFHRYSGFSNIFYLLCVYVLQQTCLPGCFLYLTSFIHYFHYLGTYYYRKNINFGLFKRDVIFFKSVAVAQMAYIYYSNYELNILSFVLIFFGVFLSTAAAVAIGADRTYFGAELGYYEPKWIEHFPYNIGIPHPMIIGALLWLAGLHALPGFRAQVPLLVPIHMAFYITHMLQEQFDIHHGAKEKMN